jgi:hypothetical protein
MDVDGHAVGLLLQDHSVKHRIWLLHEVIGRSTSAADIPISEMFDLIARNRSNKCENLRVNVKTSNAVIDFLLDVLEKVPAIMQVKESDDDINARLQ